MSCRIAQTGLAVTAPSPSRPSSARNGYLLKRPFKSRPRCVHQRGQRPGEPCRDTNAIGPTGQRFFLQSQPQATQVAYQRKRLARWAETCSVLAYGSPGRCPGLGERRAFGPAKYRVSGKRTGMRRSHSDPRLWASFCAGQHACDCRPKPHFYFLPLPCSTVDSLLRTWIASARTARTVASTPISTGSWSWKAGARAASSKLTS